MGNLNDVDDEFDADEVIEKMKMNLKKVQEEAAEAKKASDLKLQKAMDSMLEATRKLEEVKALPSPLEALGWSKPAPRQRKQKQRFPPPVPGTEHRYLRSYDAYIMTPAYAEYLRKTEKPCPNFEELD
jgi:hypothetical protein